MTNENIKLSCCANPRLKVDESFSYEAWFTDEGKLYIDINDYVTDGFENVRCTNCGRELGNEQEFEW